MLFLLSVIISSLFVICQQSVYRYHIPKMKIMFCLLHIPLIFFFTFVLSQHSESIFMLVFIFNLLNLFVKSVVFFSLTFSEYPLRFIRLLRFFYLLLPSTDLFFFLSFSFYPFPTFIHHSWTIFFSLFLSSSLLLSILILFI